jgi:hypothetical protein
MKGDIRHKREAETRRRGRRDVEKTRATQRRGGQRHAVTAHGKKRCERMHGIIYIYIYRFLRYSGIARLPTPHIVRTVRGKGEKGRRDTHELQRQLKPSPQASVQHVVSVMRCNPLFKIRVELVSRIQIFKACNPHAEKLFFLAPLSNTSLRGPSAHKSTCTHHTFAH